MSLLVLLSAENDRCWENSNSKASSSPLEVHLKQAQQRTSNLFAELQDTK